ncbi:MAG: hypothetical protein KJZ70_06790 [Bryobacterales bacterium]|nr:hypothetical protein [Bryobacterales bacterium]
MSRSPQSPFLAAAAVACLGAFLALPAAADTSFTVKRMTRTDVPSGKGQCDIRFRVDNEVEMAIRGDRVDIRTIAGRDARDDGSECNFPLPVGQVNNFRWEKRDGRGRVELMEEPTRRSGNRAIFNVRDSDGGEGRYHIRLNWDIEGSSNISGNRPGWRGESNRGDGGRGGTSGNRGDGWGSASNSNNSGWGSSSSSNNSGWGNSSGWGNVRPPSSLNTSGRGTVTWDRRANLTANRASVRVTGERAVIRIETSENRTVEFRGRVTSSSDGFFEVDLDDSTEGAIDGMARVDYRNNSTLDRIDLYGNSGNNRFRVDFRR